MSYHIYTTDGIILKRTPFGEANILVHILTRDLGLIMASARSARLYVSKLRPALQEYAFVSVSCIKGKNGWKVTNVVSKGSFYFDYPQYSHKTMSQITSVLMQMIQGEHPHKEVFEIVKNALEFLRTVSEEYISEFEALVVLRILKELGYVVNDSSTEMFLNDEWSEVLLQKTKENKVTIVGVINKALKASHL
ncbi:MAG: DNA repair protein RecO [Parcubacteria group bacterium Gr01-1014_46]|nr:MAG: DNA repair protein RecO [Parcubacteria group bacterium Gr01-1014_46]